MGRVEGNGAEEHGSWDEQAPSSVGGRAMSEDLAIQIGAYVRALDEAQLPVTLFELTDRGVNYDLADSSDEQFVDDSMVDVLWEDVERPTPSQTRRWSGVAIAVAAAILVVVGVVVVADDNGGGVVTEAASSAAEADPVPSPGVVDSLAYRWSRVPHDEAVFGGEGDQSMSSVIAGGPGLVAVGSAGSEDDGDAAVWTSVDGMTWSRVAHDEAVFGGEGAQSMSSVIAGGPGLVAVGSTGSDVRPWSPGYDADAAVWTSVDGITWSRVAHDEAVFGGAVGESMFGVTVGGPGLVAVGGPGQNADNGGDAVVWTSVDGITWSRVPHDEAVFGGERVQSMFSVTIGSSGLVAVGSDSRGTIHNDSDAAAWTSVDGMTWSRVAHDEAVFGGSGFQDMASVTIGGPGLVAVGSEQPGDDVPEGPASHAAVWTSADGITWSRVLHDESIFGGTGGQGMASVIADGTRLVAVGRDGGGYGTRADVAVWTSVDGIAWSRLPHDEMFFGGSLMTSVTVGGSDLVAVGHDWSGDDKDVDAVVWVATREN